MKLDGRKIRDDLYDELKEKIASLKKKPVLAVILVGDDFASQKFVESKEAGADKIGAGFQLIKFSSETTEKEVIDKIEELNKNDNITGIMSQIPLPENYDLNKVIATIDSKKDVDGLRFSAGLNSSYLPPVVLAVLNALEMADPAYQNKKIALLGRGFLVGAPLIRVFEQKKIDFNHINRSTVDIKKATIDCDIVISATGVAGIVQSDMIKEGAILIDAGTTELGGKLAGDIDPACYAKASSYTPVPGGIGPMTVAMLMSNLVNRK